ncbi:MAG: amino acid adenylation domain-containing protein [Bacteroidota bacterium]
MTIVKEKLIQNYWTNKTLGCEAFEATPSQGFMTHTVLLKGTDLDYFSQLTSENAIAEFTVFLAVYGALLERYFQEVKLVFSNGLAEGRDKPLLYSLETIEGKTLKEYIQKTKLEVQEVYKYANYKELPSQMESLQRYSHFGLCYHQEKDKTSDAPFVLSITKHGPSRLELSLRFSETISASKVALHFLQNFASWIKNLKSFSTQNCSGISIVSKDERYQLLQEFNNTSVSYPKKNFIDLFEEHAHKTPFHTAIVDGTYTLTYEELHSASNQFSNYLQQEYELSPGDLIGIKLPRTASMVVAIIGVLKAAAAYVPIDIEYPEKRIAYMESDSNCRLIVDEKEFDSFKAMQASYSEEKIKAEVHHSQTAYVIYTSGSTGNPKGVSISHQSLSQLLFWAAGEFDASKFEIVYAATSHCFDLSVFEMFFALSIGKKIRLLSHALVLDDYLKTDVGILLNTVPSTARILLDRNNSFHNVAMINLAGEPLPLDLAKKLLTYPVELRNLYGPSEDTTYSTCYRFSKKDVERISIGKPISNTQIYIVDAYGQLLPIGVAGKLYISGEGLAKGYLNRPELTAEKFIPNPFEKGKRMYDTGDLARWSYDGTIDFLGRKDHQIKLRGYRIELLEIENAIRSYSDDIIQTVVDVKQANGEPALVGYFSSKREIDKSLVRAFLVSKMPSFMVPNYLVFLDTIPMTLNGKIDRKALPEIAIEDVTRARYVPAGNEEEKTLVAIWEEVLGVKNIGIEDHFFEMGGHSLMISQIINRIFKQMGKEVTFKAFYENPTIEILAQNLTSKEYAPIHKVPQRDAYPATTSQHRFWLLSQLEGGDQAYQIAGAFRWGGAMHINDLQDSVRRVVTRHEVLRTRFQIDETGNLEQLILPEKEIDCSIVEMDFSVQENPVLSVQNYINKENEKPFDLSKAPLFRISVLKMGTNDHVLYLSMHHIISDGWSLEIFIDEVLTAYQSISQKKPVVLPPLAVQFKDYAVWLEQALLNSQQAAKSYWLEQFSEVPAPLEIPSFVKRPLTKTYTGRRLQHYFSSELLIQLKEFSKSKGVTLFMTLMSGVKALLVRYTGQLDLVVGTPLAGREHPDIEKQIGLFLNTLAIRTLVETNDSFLELLQKEKQQLLDAFTHQNYPFDLLVEQLNLPRDTSRSPLFDVMVVLQNQQQLASLRNTSEITQFDIKDFEIPKRTSQFDLSFTFTEKQGLKLELDYNTHIYEAKFAERIFEHLENLFEQILKDPELPITAIPIITAEEQEKLKVTFNATKTPYDRTATVLDLVRKQTLETPDQIAVFTSERRLTYIELEQESNQLAHYLIKQYKLFREDLVAIQLERGDAQIVAILAVLKAACAYVPIDIVYPESRVQYILKDSQAKVLIDSQFLETFFEAKRMPVSLPKKKIIGSQLAYVIYTSGSTGKPKGVMVEHKSLLNLCLWHNNVYKVTDKSRGSLFSGTAFDASVWEIFPYLAAGATLYPIQNEEIRINHDALVGFFETNKITHAYVPSKVCQDLVELEISQIETLILTGGEALKYGKNTALSIYNNYGPTENTVVSTYFDCLEHDGGKIPIGKPIYNTEVYVLSEALAFQPIGAVGELCISGDGLARGYWNSTELTAEKFVAHPFKEGERLYKTGDLARWLPNGNLEFLGRKDEQVKIRGHRIELGEIEHTLLAYSESVKEARVQLAEIGSKQSLVAYFVASATIDKKAIRIYLKSILPEYMVPAYFVPLHSIPLTVNGKVDGKNLPTPSQMDRVSDKFVAPATVLEVKVVEIWEDLLELKNVGMTDDFFELGGHSLLLTKLTNQYRKIFNVELNLKQIYSNTRVSYHVQLLKRAKKVHFESIKKVPNAPFYDVSPSQLRYWLLYKMQGKSKEFNIFSELELPSPLKIEAFEQAFNHLLERHEIIRTHFLEKEGIPKQIISDFQTVRIPYYPSDSLDQARQDVFEHQFELERSRLYKVALIKKEETFVLLFNMHHSISDGWSMNILSNELLAIYEGIVAQETPDIPVVEVHYKDYVQWQSEAKQRDVLEPQKLYWLDQLSGEPPYLQLPLDYVAAATERKSISGYHTIYFDEKIKAGVDALCQNNKVTVFSVFVAALNVLLNRLTSEEDVIIGIPAANRNHSQLKHMVGCFLNTLMLRNTVNKQESFQSFLLKVNENLMDALAHQNYPFEQLLEELKVPKDYNRFPLSPIFLNLLDFDARSRENLEDFTPKHGTLEVTPKFEFECYLKSFANGYQLHCVYDYSLFKEETIAYWITEFDQLLQQVVDGADKPIFHLNLFQLEIPTQSDAQPQEDFNYFEDLEIEQSIANRFEKQVAKFPSQIAIYSGNRSLSYTQLNHLANQLGQRILQHTKTSTRRVALLLGHDETAVVGMLGTLKAGFSYVPIDINSPVNRIEFILKDAECDLLICSAATLEKAKILEASHTKIKLLEVSTHNTIVEYPNLEIKIAPKNEAYVLYTSGSTGAPKGVVQNQRNVLHYIRVYTNNIHISERDNLSLFSTYTFDASVKDIFGALLNGATVSIYDITEQGLEPLPQWLRLRGVTIMHMVPTIYRYFLSELKEDEILDKVRILDLGGEACFQLDLENFKRHFPKDAFLVNDYGPTEATIISQKFLSHDHRITRNYLPLGRPVKGTEVFLLDETNDKKGIYEEGEITYRSDFLSLGYLNRPELTEKVFLQDVEGWEGRLYKSGDIGSLLPTGEIEFIRRKDGQVKLNGQRIELADIEQNLLKIPDVLQAIVVLTQIDGQDKLIGYLQTSTKLLEYQIVSKLSSLLPSYMIPLTYVFLNEFPRTRTGKIDRKSLPLPAQQEKNKEFIAPRNELEQQLVEILSRGLSIPEEKVSINDNFFDLGGNSLKMIKVLHMINEKLNVQLTVLTLFKHPSVQLLVDEIYGTKVQKELLEVDVSESMDDMIDLLNE